MLMSVPSFEAELDDDFFRPSTPCRSFSFGVADLLARVGVGTLAVLPFATLALGEDRWKRLVVDAFIEDIEDTFNLSDDVLAPLHDDLVPTVRCFVFVEDHDLFVFGCAE